MKTLLVLRHAKSSWKDNGLEDHDRPLNKRGKKAAPQMGKLIKKEELTPDLILSSTALRAKTTAELVAQHSKYVGEILFERRLYLAGPANIVEILQEIETEPAGRVMIVGHNPGHEELVRCLTGQDERFPTAALAQIQLPIKTWKELELSTEGALVRLWRPREIED
jgi:phosphohistidine phosphatase